MESKSLNSITVPIHYCDILGVSDVRDQAFCISSIEETIRVPFMKAIKFSPPFDCEYTELCLDGEDLCFPDNVTN